MDTHQIRGQDEQMLMHVAFYRFLLEFHADGHICLS